jgi:hypothetical protein
MVPISRRFGSRDAPRPCGLSECHIATSTVLKVDHFLNAPHLVALVGAGATFPKGKLLERPTDEQAA